jgi:hypothetical protein
MLHGPTEVSVESLKSVYQSYVAAVGKSLSILLDAYDYGV